MKYYKIAGLCVAMETFGRTAEQAEPYQFSEIPNDVDIVISSFRGGLMENHPEMTEDLAEYLGTGISFYRELLNFDGFQLHSSAVVVDGRAYLFSANSGTGKSTHTSMWLQKFGDRAYILNDDKPALRMIDGIWYAFGTPWSGKYDMSVNIGVPVAGVAMIERWPTNEIAEYGGSQAVFALLCQTVRPKPAEYRLKLLELLDRFIKDVPIWRLQCNMNQDAVDTSYGAMSQGKGERI